MSPRPDITAALDAGETLLWQGAPRPGRPTPARRQAIAAGLYALSLALTAGAWYLAVFRLHSAEIQLLAYALVAAAAFATFAGLRVSALATRRARARDARTAYAITDRRALTLSGPYRAEVRLAPGLRIARDGQRLDITGDKGTLSFDRLADADAAHDILLARIGEMG